METTAEISATFAGFVSIFFVLARGDGSFDPSVAILIRLILIASVFCLFFSAVPLVLAVLDVSEPVLWRGSSFVMLGVATVVSGYAIRNQRLFRRSFLVPIAYSFNAAAFLALFLNVIGWPTAPMAGLHIAALWLILCIAALNFIDLVFYRLLERSAG